MHNVISNPNPLDHLIDTLAQLERYIHDKPDYYSFPLNIKNHIKYLLQFSFTHPDCSKEARQNFIEQYLTLLTQIDLDEFTGQLHRICLEENRDYIFTVLATLSTRMIVLPIDFSVEQSALDQCFNLLHGLQSLLIRSHNQTTAAALIGGLLRPTAKDEKILRYEVILEILNSKLGLKEPQLFIETILQLLSPAQLCTPGSEQISTAERFFDYFPQLKHASAQYATYDWKTNRLTQQTSPRLLFQQSPTSEPSYIAQWIDSATVTVDLNFFSAGADNLSTVSSANTLTTREKSSCTSAPLSTENQLEEKLTQNVEEESGNVQQYQSKMDSPLHEDDLPTDESILRNTPVAELIATVIEQPATPTMAVHASKSSPLTSAKKTLFGAATAAAGLFQKVSPRKNNRDDNLIQKGKGQEMTCLNH